MTSTPANAVLLVSCPDRQGLIAAFSSFLSEHDGNIVDLEQHVDLPSQQFFMRLEWALDGFRLGREQLPAAVGNLAARFGAQWEIHFTDKIPRLAILVSRHAHCLLDLLARVQSGELGVCVPVVISNHADCRRFVEPLGIDYHELPVTPANRSEQERRLLDLLAEHNVDFVVLARYMQILGTQVVDRYPNRIINIHHSFLPAFSGARPYHRAYKRGVKLIGATSHYVTADLDEGPIIEQDVARVSHTDAVEDMMRKGRDLEKLVLARAIFKHLQRKVLVYENRTLVFV